MVLILFCHCVNFILSWCSYWDNLRSMKTNVVDKGEAITLVFDNVRSFQPSSVEISYRESNLCKLLPQKGLLI